MLESYSSKAIATKARAMYGRRLTVSDYNEMIKRTTVGEVAVYLRDNTHYAHALADLRTEDARRGALEERLRSLRYKQYAALTRYSFARGTGFYQYIFLWDEIEQLIRLLRYIGAGGEGEHFPRYSRFLERYCSYDLRILSTTRDYPSLLEALERTDYHEILAKYPPSKDSEESRLELVLCECELRNYYYARVFGLIDKQFSGRARHELHDLFLQAIDAENLADAYRLRRFFHSDPDYIRRALLPYKTASSKLIESIASCTDDAQLTQLLTGSRFVRDGRLDMDYIENLTTREKERVSRKAMRYSTVPAVTLVGYMDQSAIELENVVNIIEGIRYGLDPLEIHKLLILPA